MSTEPKPTVTLYKTHEIKIKANLAIVQIVADLCTSSLLAFFGFIFYKLVTAGASAGYIIFWMFVLVFGTQYHSDYFNKCAGPHEEEEKE